MNGMARIGLSYEPVDLRLVRKPHLSRHPGAFLTQRVTLGTSFSWSDEKKTK